MNDIVIQIRDKEPDPDVGMFTKKGLTNCASCEKNIVNLLKEPADHQNWNRLPFREPNERIARVSFPLFCLIYILSCKINSMLKASPRSSIKCNRQSPVSQPLKSA